MDEILDNFCLKFFINHASILSTKFVNNINVFEMYGGDKMKK